MSASVAHVTLAVGSSALLAAALTLAGGAGRFDSPGLRDLFTAVVPLASLGASLVAALQGWLTGRPRELLAYDVVAMASLVPAVALARVAPMSNELTGAVLCAVVIARLAPVVVDTVRSGARPVVPFLAALVAYGAFGTLENARMFAQGDQPHTLMAAEALRMGTFDLRVGYGDGSHFRVISGVPLPDEPGHVAAAPGGERLIQGYGLPLLVLPGWVIGGVLGAKLSLAVVGAAASALAYLISRELAGDRRPARLAWALTSFLVPFLSYATLVYSSIVGALLLASAFRWLFTAPVRRPVLAAAAVALTLLLTPRDALPAFMLLPLAAWLERPLLARFSVVLLAGVAVAAAFTLAAYGTPLPYAGYFAAIGGGGPPPHDQPLVWTRVDLALPGILFDRAFGLAGSAPWVFIGLLGLVPLLRERPVPARAALLVVIGTVGALMFYRAWHAGWAPPNRYLVALLPLWAPFVAAGLAVAARSPIASGASVALAVTSAIATFTLSAHPVLAYTLGEVLWTEWLRGLGLDPLGWLPSLALDEPGSFYLRSIAAALLVAPLIVLGLRHATVRREVAPQVGPAREGAGSG